MPKGRTDDLPGFLPASEHLKRSTSAAAEATERSRRRHTAPPKAAPPPADLALERFPLHPKILEVLRAQGISGLYPPQAEALRPALQGKSVVLACPTSSGKSLVAYAALLTAALEGRRGLYLVPLRALAAEKYRDLRAFDALGLKVALTMGERDLSSADLDAVDILVATSEKADSLLRHRSPWMDRVGVVVADEVHLLRDASRGPTLEVSLTRLLRRHRGLQVLALSATVGNSPDLARWLGATLVQSDYRPVPLRQGVYRDGRITFLDASHREIDEGGEAIEALVRDILREKGQALVFVNSRRSTVSLATRLGKVVRPLLTPTEHAELSELATKLGGDSEEVTEGVRQLGSLVPSGTAFHNASLTNEERSRIEGAFRERRLKCLVATTTLAAGLNLPARRVIVRDTTRYDDDLGQAVKLPALEVHQMLGRAGRPGLDPYGEALLLAKSGEEEDDQFDRYLTARPEDVESQLGGEGVLRTHLLALIASGEVTHDGELQSFLERTFYGQQAPVRSLQVSLARARSFLEHWGLLERTHGRGAVGTLAATPFGKMTSELYLDPVTAVLLRRATERATKATPPFHFLLTLALTPDLAPLSVRRGDDEAAVLSRWEAERGAFLLPEGEDDLVPSEEVYRGSLKTALLLEAWLDDRTPLDEITSTFGVGAGDLRARVERAQWLLSAWAFLAARERRELMAPLDLLCVRVRYGIRPELADLVSLRGIGRVRSRKLLEAGLLDVEAVAHAEGTTLARVLGSERLAEQVLAVAQRRMGRILPARPAARGDEPTGPERPRRSLWDRGDEEGAEEGTGRWESP